MKVQTGTLNHARLIALASIASLSITLVAVSDSHAAAAPTPPGGPTVNIKEPVSVTVDGPVEVQGVVEVINDVLRQPFRQTRSQTTSVGLSATIVDFDVPAGKRLIVETISIRARVNLNEVVEASMSTPGTDGTNATSTALPLAKQGTFSTTNFPDHYSALHSVRIRVDGTAATNELSFILTRNLTAGSGELVVTVHGYVVDIAP
jgi:hypothetical protein